MKQVFIAFFAAAMLSSCNSQPAESQASETPSNEIKNQQKMSKKETAHRFISAVLSQDVETVRELVNEDYIQHNPYIPTGREAFIGLFPILEHNGTSAQAARVFEDGNYIVFHHLWTGATPFGADEMVSFDILRFDENGKIAEHWDAMMPNTPPNPSGRGLIDGESAVTDPELTERNKAFTVKLFKTIASGDLEAVGALVNENFLPDYHQHNPTMADGIPAVFEAFGREQWVYNTNHIVLGEGNFTLAVSEGTAKGVPTVFYDLLRFENGKVAEHWDVIQPIPSEGLANENGMFGF